ncbi:MAG: hypothetical protein AABW85_02930, partial [archaeon]
MKFFKSAFSMLSGNEKKIMEILTIFFTTVHDSIALKQENSRKRKLHGADSEKILSTEKIEELAGLTGKTPREIKIWLNQYVARALTILPKLKTLHATLDSKGIDRNTFEGSFALKEMYEYELKGSLARKQLLINLGIRPGIIRAVTFVRPIVKAVKQARENFEAQ